MSDDAAAPRHFRAMLTVSGRCSYLLIALVLLIMVYPFCDPSRPFDQMLFGVLNSAILIAGTAAASRKRRAPFFALSLAVPTLALQWLHFLYAAPEIQLLFLGIVAIFYLFTITHVLIYVLGPGPVTGDKIHGAVATYILIGLMWTSLYLLVDRLLPGSFTINGVSDRTTPLAWEQLVFFSFVTLTSTGYGWFVPASHHAQSLAILEQLAGVFYVAILIARLAGLYKPGAGRGNRNPGDAASPRQESPP